MQTIAAQVGSPDTAFGFAGSESARSGSIGPFREAWSRPLAGVAGRVGIWFVPTGAHLELAQHAHVLGRDDWSAIARLRDAAARDHARAAKIALRLALSHAVGGTVKPAAWRFQATAYGKPQVAPGLPDVRFCISHIDTMAVIAVARDVPVGVDIETIGACNDKVIEAVCSAAERRMLAQLGEPARRQAFARLWTLKEATAKLTGTGLAADFRFLEFGAGPEQHAAGTQAQHLPGQASTRSWLTEAPGGLCQVAVAVGDADAETERGELVCFAVGCSGDVTGEPRTLNPGRGERTALTLS